MKYLPFLLYLLLVALHQVFLREISSVAGASINMAAFLVIGVALYKSEITAIWFGFVVGITLAAGEPTEVGWHALTLSLIGLTAFHLCNRLNLDSLRAKLLLMFGGVFIHNILSLLIRWEDDLLLRLIDDAAAGALYTTLLGWLFFLVKDGRLTMKKMRDLF